MTGAHERPVHLRQRLDGAADLAAGALLSVALLVVNVASVSAQLGFLHKAKQVKEYDHWRYIEMSRGPDGKPELQREPPYCFRLAVPALARGLTRLGLGENAAFYLLTNAALFGFLLLLWLHLRDLGFPLALRVTGLLVTGFTQGAVRWFEYQYWMSDPLALLLVMLAFVLLERSRLAAVGAVRVLAAVGVVSVLAAFVRETYVLVYPYLFLRELRLARGDAREPGLPASAAASVPGWPAPARRALARTAAIAALPVAILVAIRRVVTPNQPDDFAAGIADSMTFRMNHLLDNQLYVVTIGAFGVLVPLLLLFPARLPALARRHFDRVLFVASVYATLVISNNNERPLAYALPALVPAAVHCLRLFLAETRLPAIPVLCAVVLLQVLFWAGQRFAEIGMSIYQPVNWTTVAAMTIAWLAAQVALRHARAEAPASE